MPTVDPRAKLDVLIKEIQDRHAQENWYRLKLYLEQLQNQADTITNIINNIGTSPWVQLNKVAPASSTYTADVTPLSAFECLQYIVCMKEVGGVKTKRLKIDIRHADTDVEDQVYAKEGDAMDVGVNAVVVGSNVELQFTNNELYSVDLSFARLTL